MFAKTSLFQKSKQIQNSNKKERDRSDREKIAIEEGKGDDLPGSKPNPGEVNHGNKKIWAPTNKSVKSLMRYNNLTLINFFYV